MPGIAKVVQKAIFYGIVYPLIALVFGGLLFMMLCLPVLEFFAETWDILTLRATTEARVVGLDVIRGDRGTSRPEIEYAYVVKGVNHRSKTYSPGFLGEYITWSGGGRDAQHYSLNQLITIHYDLQRPERSCIAYGWHKWPVGLIALFWGFAFNGHVRKMEEATGTCRPLLSALSLAIGIGSFIMLGVSPSVVRISELHWYAFAFIGVFLVILGFRHNRRKMGGSEVILTFCQATISPLVTQR